MANKLNDKQIKALLKSGQPVKQSVGNGLYFRISSEGTGFWVMRYSIHKKRREITLGSYPSLSLSNANAEAVLLQAEVKKGRDPLAERARAKSVDIKTVDDLANDWLESCDKRLKHPGVPRRIYKKDIAPTIGQLSLDHVNPRDIRAVIAKIVSSNRPATANDALMYCKQLFRHGIKLDLITSNPADAFTLSDAGGVERSRSRTLSIDELNKVFCTFRENTDQFTRDNYLAVAILISLGVRKGELIAAQWVEFDLTQGLWDIPKERSKTEVGITIPLAPCVIEWLNELHIRSCGSEYVFPNRRASKRFSHMSPDTLNAATQKLFKEKKVPVEHFTIHDLRRTCRSLLASIGVAGHVAERCLNHKLKGVEGIYDRYDYLDERREALEKLACLVEPIVTPAANVVSFGKSA